MTQVCACISSYSSVPQNKGHNQLIMRCEMGTQYCPLIRDKGVRTFKIAVSGNFGFSEILVITIPLSGPVDFVKTIYIYINV